MKLIRVFSQVASIQIIATALTLFLVLYYTRVLTIEEFGSYALLMSVVSLASLLAVAGINISLVRTIPVSSKETSLRLIELSRRRVFYRIFFITPFVVLFLFEKSDYLSIVFSCILIVLKCLTIRETSILNGMGKHKVSQIFLFLLFPLYNGVINFVLFLFDIKLTITLIIAVMSLSSLLVQYQSRCYRKRNISSHEFEEEDSSKIVANSSIFWLSLVSVIDMIGVELGTLILGFFGSPDDIALFRIASQTMILAVMVISSMNIILNPNISKLYGKSCNNTSALQLYLTKSVRLTCFIIFPILSILFIFGEYAIVTVFGQEYKYSHEIIKILIFGQVFNSLCGSVGVVLNMTTNEKISVFISTLGLIIYISLVIIGLALKFNVLYLVAIGSALNVIFINVSSSYYINKKFGLITWLR
ncbi:hypothetical protein FCU94_00420 [Vibrio sp. JPW-9-11-11]|uniref:oligosaccharide flippase family protein n=1 Tax=Vibrio sp. JPW-9-11-11 TaxID=1416532 RepID=UPI00159461EB|nr:oligosaccharide flippase family protein [Vibrio sp. JPW-9-11-11]NVD05383.1 hypothetical protein [Vibrio sp. JPW-9-11-11]